MTDNAHKDVRIGIIGGSGLGDKLGLEQGEQRELDTPFGPPSSPLTITDWQGTPVVLLQRHGPGHTYNPTNVPYRANIFAMKLMGVTHLITSGATGSLREDVAPGELMLVDQVIDRTKHRTSTFFEQAAVHVEFAEPYCPVMRKWLWQAGEQLEHIRVHQAGTYVCMEGPAFSTRAESNLHRHMGGDLIGMTAMPEAKLAREAEIACALVALPTDYDCWRPHDPGVAPQALLEEIIGNLTRAVDASVALIKQAMGDISLLQNEPSPAHDALRLAIWSNKDMIDKAEVQRLAALWERYFED